MNRRLLVAFTGLVLMGQMIGAQTSLKSQQPLSAMFSIGIRSSEGI